MWSERRAATKVCIKKNARTGEVRAIPFTARVEQALGPVQVRREAPHLGADEPVGERVAMVPVEAQERRIAADRAAVTS